MDELQGLPPVADVVATALPDEMTVEQFAIEARLSVATINFLLQCALLDRSSLRSRVEWADLLAATSKARF